MPALRSGRCRQMNEAEIRKYAALMQELGLTGLEITDEKNRVRLERNEAAQVKETVYAVPDAIPQAQTETKNEISVRSPIVGVFYAAPTENAASYVSVGDAVKKGQVLCIVEAMKLMNEITAEEDGIISEICVTNGQVVEYGTELFRLKR